MKKNGSPVSKYLKLPAAIPKTLSRAHLLTSSDALAQLERKKEKIS